MAEMPDLVIFWGDIQQVQCLGHWAMHSVVRLLDPSNFLCVSSNNACVANQVECVPLVSCMLDRSLCVCGQQFISVCVSNNNVTLYSR